MLSFNWYQFNELSLQQLYDVLTLRSQVFVVEQKCDYLDPDGLDQVALHLIVKEQEEIVGYLRLFPPKNNKIKFGRVIIAKSARTKGYGKMLIQELLNYCAKSYADAQIECSAQLYLKKFYESFGFKQISKTYQDAGIAHIDMSR